MATTAGVMAGLSPVILGISLCVWIITLSIWKYVSVASIVAAIILPIAAVLVGKDIHFIIFAAVVSIVGIYAHRSNIRRLIQEVNNNLLHPHTKVVY